MSDNKSFAKNETLTFIQVICAISVVILHTNGDFWKFSKTEGYWFSANIIEHAFVFAVPLFFMISGITLMDYKDKYSTKEFFRKRISKAVIPYIIWSIIAVFYIYLMEKGNFQLSFKCFLNNLFNGQMLPIYWFFPNLFMVYLMMPLFASIDKGKKESTLKYLLVVGLVFNVFLPFVINRPETEITWPYEIYAISSYMIWVVMGYVLYYYPPKRWIKVLICVVAIIGFFMQTYGTYYLSMRDGEINKFFKGYNKLPMIMYAPGVFLFLFSIGEKLMKIEIINKIVCLLGKYTFAIYLMHWFVMNFITVKFEINTLSIWWRLGAPIPIGLIVIAITWLIRKIPIVRNIVP